MQVYVLQSCDQWKSHKSMNIIGVYGSFKILIEQLKILRDENQLGEYEECNVDLEDPDITFEQLKNLEFVYIESYELDFLYKGGF